MSPAASGFAADAHRQKGRILAADESPLCPASGIHVDQYRLNGDGVGWCITCTRYVTAEPVDETRRVWRIDDHEPRVDPRGKPGIHSPECVDHDDPDECVCDGIATQIKAGVA